MDYEEIMSLLNSNDTVPTIRFYKYVTGSSTRHCDNCLRYSGEIFAENDPDFPELPLHQNCDCSLIEVDQEEYSKQQDFSFGKMTHIQWDNQNNDEKDLWCNAFRQRFGDALDKYAQQYNVPKQLLAGIVANEMLDWKFPDGTIFDGISGGGVGYAQIAIKTAQAHGITGTEASIRQQLNSYDGSIAIAAKILSDYLVDFQKSIKNEELGSGFKKSALYSMANPSILQQKELVDIKVPDWLLKTMCAVWNSGIEVIYAKDPIGNSNYRNADIQGRNALTLSNYLPKLVKK